MNSAVRRTKFIRNSEEDVVAGDIDKELIHSVSIRLLTRRLVRTGHQLAEAYRLDTVQANISNRFRRTEKHLEWGLKANILLQRIVPYKKWEKLENDRKTVHIIRIGVSNLILKAKEPGLS